MTGYRQRKLRVGLTKCPDLVDHGLVSQINHQATTAPVPGERYTRGFLTGRPRVLSLFMALGCVLKVMNI